MVACSAALINFNKYVLQSFPFPMYLMMLHMAFCSFFAALLFILTPSLFPSLTDPQRRITFDRGLLLGGVLPIAISYAGNLFFSNLAYLYCSVAYLQMMKQGNVVFVYAASVLVGLEALRWRSTFVLLFIMLATFVNITGEIHFSLVGTLVQGASQFFEVIRIVLQATLLSGSGKLDALSFVLVVMPQCLLSFAFVLLVHYYFPFIESRGLDGPSMDHVHLWPQLLLSCSIAFLLNVSIALFVKYSSAVALVLAGLVKDALVVLISCGIMHEAISNMQRVGLTMQLAGIFVWSTMKSYPHVFGKHGFVIAFRLILSGNPNEIEPLGVGKAA